MTPTCQEPGLAHIAEVFGQLIGWCRDPIIAECIPTVDQNGDPLPDAEPFWSAVDAAEEALEVLRSRLRG